VRGTSIAQRMSDYLVREIESTPNIVVHLNCEIAGAVGDLRLRSLLLRDRISGEVANTAASAVFILIGAAPSTEWLPPAIERDKHGFILTGPSLPSASAAGHHFAFGTSVPGVFAVGDVRSGAAQRVASAVGEGSVAVGDVHAYLAAQRHRLPAVAAAVSIAST
jgi:thioredoxin reductase (NADPH)